MKTRVVAGLLMIVFMLVAVLVPASVGRVVGAVGCSVAAVAVITDAVFDWVPEVEEDMDDWHEKVM